MKSRTKYKLECCDTLGRRKATLEKMSKKSRSTVGCIFEDLFRGPACPLNASADAEVHLREFLLNVGDIEVGNWVPCCHDLCVG